MSGTAATFSAVIAAWQIQQNRADQSRRAVFEHLREIEARLSALLPKDTQAISASVLRCYREGGELSEDGKKYLSFLNALDMLALARRYRVVHRKVADEYVRTLFSDHLVSLTFLDAFQLCCDDKRTYEHLRQYVVDNRNNLRKEERRLMTDPRKPEKPSTPPPPRTPPPPTAPPAGPRGPGADVPERKKDYGFPTPPRRNPSEGGG